MSGKIPQYFIDDLLSRIDIVEVIDQRTPLKKAGKDYKACCPFHDERTPSFTVSQVKQFYHCFGCGAGGNIISFLMNYDHMEFPEAIEELARIAGVEVPEEALPTATRNRQQTDDLLPIIERASRYFQTQLRQHANGRDAIDYLKNRGLSGEIAKRFEIGFAPDIWSGLLDTLGNDPETGRLLEKAGLLIRRDTGGFYDRFRGRIMFPIRDHRGRIVGFGGRIIADGEPKYMNSPETPVFHKGSELYGLYAARDAIIDADTSIVVEGYMDVVALAQHGIDNVVAALGTATTTRHLQRLFRVASHVVFCFDGDRAGREAALKALEICLTEMHGGRQVSFLFLPEGLDPDDFVRAEGADAFHRAVTEAEPLDEFLFSHLRNRTDLKRRDGRARLIELARPLIVTIPPGPYKEMLTRRLGEISGLDDDHYLGNLVGGATQQRPTPRPARPGTAPPESPSSYAHLISLLLQHPRLIHLINNLDDLEIQTQPAAQILASLIDLLREDDQKTTATLVERFRDTPHHARLEKLASWNHQVADGQLEETVLQTANSVRRLMVENAIDRLLETAATGSLNDDEKAELNRYMRLKHELQPEAEIPPETA